MLAESAQPPSEAEPTDVSEGLFRPAPDQSVAELELAPDARWVAEYYPVDELVELPQGRARVRMRYSDRSWMTRLLLGLGGQVRVLSPSELACDVRQRAEGALARARHLPST